MRLLKLRQKPTTPITNYLLWHTKLTNDVVIEYPSLVRGCANNLAGNKSNIFIEPINNCKNQTKPFRGK